MGHTALTRRGLLGLGAGAAAAVLLPGTGSAQPALTDPYGGAIRLAFPLLEGTYQAPVADNWHVGREGRPYPWNHVNGPGARAHDGVDIYPVPGVLPEVYAPLRGTIAAVCRRPVNTPDAALSYRVSTLTPPPWDFSQAVDDIAGLPLYGNFVWIFSAEPGSRGYFVFCCHLQDEPGLRALVPDQPVGVQSRIGAVGDTGNAAGVPQLHIEIHYPSGTGYPCSRCTPGRTLTSIDPYASLARAALRAPVAS